MTRRQPRHGPNDFYGPSGPPTRPAGPGRPAAVAAPGVADAGAPGPGGPARVVPESQGRAEAAAVA
jgi:hypothetical protein